MGGNQIVFFFFLDKTKIEDLDKTLGSLAEKPGHKLHFRLAKEIIAG